MHEAAINNNITSRGDYCSLIEFNNTWLKPYNATYTLCTDAAQKCGKVNLTSEEINYNQTHPKLENANTTLWSFYEPNKEKGFECLRLLVPYANIYWKPGTDFGGDKEEDEHDHKKEKVKVPPKQNATVPTAAVVNTAKPKKVNLRIWMSIIVLFCTFFIVA